MLITTVLTKSVSVIKPTKQQRKKRNKMDVNFSNVLDPNKQILGAAGWNVFMESEEHFFAYHSRTGRIVEHVLGNHDEGEDFEKHMAIQFKVAYAEILMSLVEQTKPPMTTDTSWDTWDLDKTQNQRAK